MQDVFPNSFIFLSNSFKTSKTPASFEILSANLELGGFWEYPGGKVEKGETDEESLKRELYEEFGIAVRVKNHLINSFYRYEKINVNLKAYLVDHVSGEFTLTDHDAIKWIDSKEFGKYEFAPADIPINNHILNHGI